MIFGEQQHRLGIERAVEHLADCREARIGHRQHALVDRTRTQHLERGHGQAHLVADDFRQTQRSAPGTDVEDLGERIDFDVGQYGHGLPHEVLQRLRDRLFGHRQARTPPPVAARGPCTASWMLAVKMAMRTCGCACRIAAAASVPSIPGMLTSIVHSRARAATDLRDRPRRYLPRSPATAGHASRMCALITIRDTLLSSTTSNVLRESDWMVMYKHLPVSAWLPATLPLRPFPHS